MFPTGAGVSNSAAGGGTSGSNSGGSASSGAGGSVAAEITYTRFVRRVAILCKEDSATE
jgi:hypothetical protein